MASMCSFAGGRRCSRAAAAALKPWLAAAALLLAAGAAPADDARCLLQRGQLRLALDGLQAEHAAATEPAARARAAAALGRAYLRLQRLAEALPLLEQATGGALPPRERAAAWVDLGNLHLAARRLPDADVAWAAAARAAPADAELQLSVALNRLRLQPAATRLRALDALLPRVLELPAPEARARLALNLAAQAADAGAAGRSLALQAYEAARTQAGDDVRLAAQAFDGLAALYEAAGRPAEALGLVEQGVQLAARSDARDLLMALEGRAARLARHLGHADLALQAWTRAVGHAEAVRSDIPVQYVDGRSSFRETLEPLYLGLTDALLRRAEAAPAEARPALLRRARDTVELIKQTELEDYLRDRCSVGSAARATGSWTPPPGTALHYPVILPDRLVLLVETAAGIGQHTVALDGARLRESVLEYVSALRAGAPLRARSEALYRVLVAPLEPLLAAERIHTLVTVPDGVLRLLPLASLHDGRGWLLQRLAVATVPGLSLTPTPRREGAPLQALLAGLSEPGPVLDKLSSQVVEAVLEPPTEPGAARSTRSPEPAARTPARAAELRQALALPGVKDEIETLSQLLPGTVLLDRQFTLAALQQAVRATRHPVLHIASHGVFGDSADTTFIMTYDELLTLDGLQALLRDDRPGDTPIEVLTLSACQTAEGDDRAPLGMSGTAIKARARTALGTLWPVSDDAANRVMAGFYRRLAAGGASRAEALRQAQLELLQQPRRQHPAAWAPFVLIGDWQ